MRPDLADETFPLVPPQPGWKLTAWGTRSIGGRVIGHGREVPDELLPQCAWLIQHGYVRWTPPSGAPKPPAPPPPAPRVTTPPPDPIEQCRVELRRLGSLDLVDGAIVARATKQYADLPKVTKSAGVGSNGAMVRSGAGTNRRCVDGFEAYLREGL